MTLSNVFVYGTLKRLQPNYHHLLNKTLGEATFLGEFKTSSAWPLFISTKANLPCLIPIENKGMQIKGEVFQVDEKMLSFLDEFEGHPVNYIRQTISVEPKSDNKTADNLHMTCWCYFFNFDVANNQDLLKDVVFLEYYDSGGDHGRPYIFEADDTRLEYS